MKPVDYTVISAILILSAALAWVGREILNAPRARCKCGSYDVPDDETMCAKCALELRARLEEDGYVGPPRSDLAETTSRLYVKGPDDEGAYRRKF